MQRMQHCWLKTPNIVGCFIWRLLAHSFLFLRVDAQSLKSGQTFEPTTPISFVSRLRITHGFL